MRPLPSITSTKPSRTCCNNRALHDVHESDPIPSTCTARMSGFLLARRTLPFPSQHSTMSLATWLHLDYRSIGLDTLDPGVSHYTLWVFRSTDRLVDSRVHRYTASGVTWLGKPALLFDLILSHTLVFWLGTGNTQSQPASSLHHTLIT